MQQVPTLTGIPEVWSKVFGDDLDAGRAFLRATNDVVETVSCPRPGLPGCPRAVTRDENGGIFAVCSQPANLCPPIRLAADDLVVHAVQRHLLGAAVAEALGLQGPHFEEISSPGLWGIGHQAFAGGERRPVFLAIRYNPTTFREAVAELLDASSSPFSIAAPTAEHIEASTIERLRRRGSVLITLCDTLGWRDDGRLASFSGSSAALPPFPDVAVPSAERFAVVSRGICRKVGDVWHIEFDGSASWVPDSRGMTYLQDALRLPRQQLHVARLFAAVAGPDAVPDLVVGNQIADERAIREYRAERDRLREQLEESREFGNEEAQAELEEKVDEIEVFIREALGLGGRPRTKGGDAERLRRPVCKAIERAISVIERSNKPLADHLRRSIRLGLFISYDPASTVSWTF